MFLFNIKKKMVIISLKTNKSYYVICIAYGIDASHYFIYLYKYTDVCTNLTPTYDQFSKKFFIGLVKSILELFYINTKKKKYSFLTSNRRESII